MNRVFPTILALLFGFSAAFIWPGTPARAQQAQADDTERLRQDINAGTVRILTAGVDSAHLIHEVAMTLNKTGSMRVLPILGDGGVQNVNDVLYLRGIDMALVRFDVLDLLRVQATYGKIERKVRYVAKLFDEEIHIVTRRSVRDIRQLAGLRVNFGDPGSGTFERADRIFRAFGVQVVPASFDPPQALRKVASGEIAATVHVSAKPSPLIRQIAQADDLHLLPLPPAGGLGNIYKTSKLTSAEYPNLIGEGASVDTLSVETVLVVYNWDKPNERAEKVARFVEAFFEQLGDIQQPYRHPKWQQVALLSDVPGWRRLQVARDWVSARVARQRREDEQVVSAAAAPLRRQFEKFLDTLSQQARAREAAARVQQRPAPASAVPERQRQAPGVNNQQLQELLTDFLRWRERQTQ